MLLLFIVTRLSRSGLFDHLAFDLFFKLFNRLMFKLTLEDQSLRYFKLSLVHS